MDERQLKDRYRRLLERRLPETASVSLETLEALAEDRLTGDERIAALDAVLADPAARAELDFLREIARERPRLAPPRRQYGLMAAAVLVTVVGSLVWRASQVPTDPLRGSETGVVLVAPGAGASLAPGDSLIWHAMPGALRYSVEVVTSDGDLVFGTETTDTLVVVGIPTDVAWPAGPGHWSVTPAGAGGGTRSAPRPVMLAPPR